MTDKPNLTPETLTKRLEQAWAHPDPADAANELRAVCIDAIAQLAADRKRLEEAERVLKFIEDDWRSEHWVNGPLSMRTVNAINAALAAGEETR